uniref:EF-hand domain-containing protein n=1 Tax=Parascaris univalens TaxID=6257 RepID=A0A914ZF15_PARUN
MIQRPTRFSSVFCVAFKSKLFSVAFIVDLSRTMIECPIKKTIPTAGNQRSLSPTCSSISNQSAYSDEGEELAAKLARRNMIAEGEVVEPAKAPKLSIYTEFHEFSRKQIKYFIETFKRFDEDGDSFIDFNELKRMMEKLGEAQTHIALKGILKLVDEDRDGKVSLREFMLIFRYAATGQLSCSEVFNELAQSIDVSKEGVQGAAGFFQAKIDELSKSSKFEEEIKQEQRERKQLEEEKKERKQNFLANKAIFSS